MTIFSTPSILGVCLHSNNLEPPTWITVYPFAISQEYLVLRTPHILILITRHSYVMTSVHLKNIPIPQIFVLFVLPVQVFPSVIAVTSMDVPLVFFSTL